MNNTKHIGEWIFYGLSIVGLILGVCFILQLLKYDDCKKLQKSQLSFFSGTIEHHYDVRGRLYIEFSNDSSTTYVLDLWALSSLEDLENCIGKKDAFEVGYSSNTKNSDYREIISLECNDMIFASVQSHNTAVSKNRCIYVGGIILFLLALVYLIVDFIKAIISR